MSPIFTAAPRPHPTWQIPLGVLAEPLESGERGTAQTVGRMRELVDQALRDPAIVRLAMDIVSRAPQYDDAAEAQAIYDWVRANIRFTKDPVNKEKLYPPGELLRAHGGDCDDISMLLAALLMAVGYPARFVTVSANQSAPDQFSHVYVEAEVPPGSNQWLAMDAARPDSEFAVGPPMYYRKRAWSLTDDSYQDLSGTKIFSRGNVIVRLAGLEQSLQTPAPTLGYYPRFRALQGLGTGLGAYQAVPHFAYPGWRLRIPGGPAGGHYKGFAANYIAGTSLDPQDQYESDRDAGMASHDAAYANPRSPRGVYRAPAEVPPAPNAGTRGYRVFRGYQTERHPGTSESPGSFPAPFVEEALEPLLASVLGVYCPPGQVNCPDSLWGDARITPVNGGATSVVTESAGGSDNIVADPLPLELTVPISPQPAPRVSVRDFIPPWQVVFGRNGVSGRVGTAQDSLADWMDRDSIVSNVKNKYVVGGLILLWAFGRRGGA